MAAEHEISQLLPLNEIEDVHRMGLQVYALREKMRALTDPREGGREHLMSLLLQGLANPLPAPAAVPSPMNQNKRSHSESASPRMDFAVGTSAAPPPWRRRRGGEPRLRAGTGLYSSF